MEMKLSAQQSLLRKRAALKNIYSALLILSFHEEDNEFLSLKRAAKKQFDLYKIEEPTFEKSNNVYSLCAYRKIRSK